MKITGVKLNQEDLVNVLSDGLYGNEGLGSSYDEKDWKSIAAKSKSSFLCYEEKLACLLLAGKKIILVDYQAEGETYGEKGKLIECDDFEAAEYHITLEDIENAFTSEEGQECLSQYLNEENDFYSGWNILQIAMFGEVIYA